MANDGNGKYNIQWSPSEYFSPKRSIAISTITADSLYFAFWGQSITSNLPIRKAVTLKVKIKAELNGAGISLVIRGDDTDDPAALSGWAEQFVTTQRDSPISVSFDWTEFSITLDKVDTTTKMLTVYLVYLQNTSGEVYFDDILLTS